MFVVGLFLGPILALAGAWATTMAGVSTRLVRPAIALVFILLLFVPAASLELRIGMVMGGFLGVLLSATPLTVERVEEK
ncbi:MAG: hypothetical protein ACR2JC_14605 [Chloroflexota bacterium]|nr:MAG: hypothetical protein DLM70_17775 [Chloroflexota bacterium]